MDKDYYEILMVHPKAEPIIIEAAYRRLAREYHPDVNKSPDAHARMVDVNAAYEVLSDPVRRRLYDLTYKPTAARTASATRPTTTAQERPQPPPPQPRPSANVQKGPPPPNPADFGIDANYLSRAMEGAREWANRRPAVPKFIKVIWVVTATATALALIAVYTSSVRGVGDFVGLALSMGWWVAPLSMIPLFAVESLRDSRLQKKVFDPKYNPNPDGYLKYAQALAQYQTQIYTVHISRNWIIHFDSVCSGMIASYDLPKWEAEEKGGRLCSKCGGYTVRARMLPPPFGYGPID